MNELFKGLQKNRSLESIDLSDNDLNDQKHADLLIRYLFKMAEWRDAQLWEGSLRNFEIERKISEKQLHQHGYKAKSLQQVLKLNE